MELLICPLTKVINLSIMQGVFTLCKRIHLLLLSMNKPLMFASKHKNNQDSL